MSTGQSTGSSSTRRYRRWPTPRPAPWRHPRGSRTLRKWSASSGEACAHITSRSRVNAGSM
eukprot:scaffold50378_cov70-Phaeocystis_antarctica.AAC.1